MSLELRKSGKFTNSHREQNNMAAVFGWNTSRVIQCKGKDFEIVDEN
jgi:hypothetical protein